MSVNISDVKIYPLKNPHPTIKANGTFILGDVVKVKFALFSGSKGLFVSLPGKYGDKLDAETGKKPWYSDVTVIDDSFRTKLNTEVIGAYNEKTGNTPINQGEAEGPVNQDNSIPF